MQRSGTDVARIVAVPAPQPFEDSFGIWKGQVRMGDDFDELPPDIACRARNHRLRLLLDTHCSSRRRSKRG